MTEPNYLRASAEMNSFLITFKPATESPERGWPLDELQKLVRRHRAGERVEEIWRFKNRRDAGLGDRVVLLEQGKGGPAIIGYESLRLLSTHGDGTSITPYRISARCAAGTSFALAETQGLGVAHFTKTYVAPGPGLVDEYGS